MPFLPSEGYRLSISENGFGPELNSQQELQNTNCKKTPTPNPRPTGVLRDRSTLMKDTTSKSRTPKTPRSSPPDKFSSGI